MTNDFPDIAVVLYNNLKPHCADIAQNLIDLTEFKLQGRYQFNLHQTTTLTQQLKELAAQGFAWAGVVAAGNFLQNQTLIIDTIEHAKSEKAPMACHILDRGGYYHLHPQWFALDLQAWTAIGQPALEEHEGPVTFVTRKTHRDTNNAHDDYTPWWVEPESEELTEYTSDRQYTGITVIAEFVRAGHRIVNIPNEIRQRKNYCYPDHGHDDIVKLIANKNHEPKDEALWWFGFAIRQITKNLDTGYYVLNTETLIPPQEMKNRPLDCFVGVCGGLKPACITGNDNFVAGARVYLFDISVAAIEWQQYLLAKWNGDFDCFETVWRDFQEENADYGPMYHSDRSISNNIDWFLNNADLTRAEFQARWVKYCGMTHTFIHLDLMDNQATAKILEITNQSQLGSYLWTSNAFVMDYLMFFKTRAWTERKTRSFVNELAAGTVRPILLENQGSLKHLSPNVQ
jgi:hypothetical protein